VIGLYIAFAIPVYLRWRAGDRFERGAWHLGERYRWIDPLAIAWIALICILFMLPIAPAGVPWDDAFDWNVVNYAPLTVGGAFLLFGGWYALSAKRWFKGPVRQGTDDELEQMEAELEAHSRGGARGGGPPPPPAGPLRRRARAATRGLRASRRG
jgi:hypothetical protein